MRSNTVIGKILHWFFRPLTKHREDLTYKDFLDKIFHISARDISDYVVIQDFHILGGHKIHRLGKTFFARGVTNSKVKRGTIVTVRRDMQTGDQVEYEFLDPGATVSKIFNSTLTEWERNVIFLSKLPENRHQRKKSVQSVRKN